MWRVLPRVAARAQPRLATPLFSRHCTSAAKKAAADAIAAMERMKGEMAAVDAVASEAMTPPSATTSASTTPSSPGLTRAAVLRFPIGATVECRLGENRWAEGIIIGHHYKEPSWAEDKRAPYQIQLKERKAKIFAPADVDECVRTTLRFRKGDDVQCFLGEDEGWAAGTVEALYHQEPSWAPSKWAPYQVRLADGPYGSSGEMIYAPEDSDNCIRAPLGWPWPGSSSGS